MDTIARVKELAAERNLSMHGLAKICDVPYSTLKNTEQRSGQLTVDTIERICLGLNIPMSMFFMTDEDWDGFEAYVQGRVKA